MSLQTPEAGRLDTVIPKYMNATSAADFAKLLQQHAENVQRLRIDREIFTSDHSSKFTAIARAARKKATDLGIASTAGIVIGDAITWPELDAIYSTLIAAATKQEAVPPAATVPRKTRMTKEAAALAVLVDHPDWTLEQIAKQAGCNRTSLNRMPKFKNARKQLASGRDELPTAPRRAAGTLRARKSLG